MNPSVSASVEQISSPTPTTATTEQEPTKGAARGRRTYSAVAAVGAAALFTDVLTDVFTGVFTDVFTDVFPDVVTGALTGAFADVFTGVFTDVFADVFPDVVTGALTGAFADVFTVYSLTFLLVYSPMCSMLYSLTFLSM